jgi:hypothetical protein
MINVSTDELQPACQWYPDVIILDVLQLSGNGWQEASHPQILQLAHPGTSIANDPHGRPGSWMAAR